MYSYLIAFGIRIALLFRVLQPLDELAHLVDEHHLPLDVVVLLVPLEDRLFRNDVRLVEEHDDLLEGAHKRHVRVAVLLHLEQQRDFGARALREGRE